MKIRAVKCNNRRRVFEVTTRRETHLFPFHKAEPSPSRADPVVELFVDEALGREAFVFGLASGGEGTVHIEQVLDYNGDPGYLRNALLYKLTVEVRRRVEESPLSKREIIRRLDTSPAQFYRLLDTKNSRKTVDKVLHLLHVLECDVELVVKTRSE